MIFLFLAIVTIFFYSIINMIFLLLYFFKKILNFNMFYLNQLDSIINNLYIALQGNSEIMYTQLFETSPVEYTEYTFCC